MMFGLQINVQPLHWNKSENTQKPLLKQGARDTHTPDTKHDLAVAYWFMIL